MNRHLSIIISLGLLVMSVHSTAADQVLKISETDKQNTLAANRAFFDAFKLPRQENWVYELADQNQLLPRCYRSKNESYAVGTSVVINELPMQCIEINGTTRIFWPIAWVEHCDSIGVEYQYCMMNYLN